MQMSQIQLINNKIYTLETLGRQVHLWRLINNTIVFTNGCFDILHRGHLEYLASASDLGGKLIVGLNSDRSVKKLKGESRPVNTFADRAFALAALHFVSAVIEFDEDTPLDLIRFIKPDVLVKGGDYSRESIVGADEVESEGGKVAIISFTEGYSTTLFLQKLRG